MEEANEKKDYRCTVIARFVPLTLSNSVFAQLENTPPIFSEKISNLSDSPKNFTSFQGRGYLWRKFYPLGVL